MLIDQKDGWCNKPQTWFGSLGWVFVFARSAVTDILAQKSVDGLVTVLKCDFINHVPHFDGKVEEAKDSTA